MLPWMLPMPSWAQEEGVGTLDKASPPPGALPPSPNPSTSTGREVSS